MSIYVCEVKTGNVFFASRSPNVRFDSVGKWANVKAVGQETSLSVYTVEGDELAQLFFAASSVRYICFGSSGAEENQFTDLNPGFTGIIEMPTASLIVQIPHET